MSQKNKQPKGNFEEHMQRLKSIVEELEQENIPLEKNVSLYKEGKALAKACKEMLDKAKHEILLVTEEGDEPFALEDEE